MSGLKSCYRSILKARLEPHKSFLELLRRQEEGKERKEEEVSLTRRVGLSISRGRR